jgi:ABC-2 type transport system ATP-binding protein
MAKRRAGTLSGGESRRLALALAFVGNPELVVLDEPTTGLDVESRRRLWDTVRALGDGRSILFTTHYLEEAEALATRIVVIDRGRLLFDGDARTLRGRVGGRRLRYVGAHGPVCVSTDDADAYVRAMVNDGTVFSDLEIVRPSLEEAFLTLTGGAR